MTLTGSIAGSVVLFFGTTLASAAGIGGGGITLPILIAVFGFNFCDAVVLSLCAVLGNILSQFALNFRARHPQNFAKPLIYWEAVLIMLPAQLAGSSIGVLLSEMAPRTALEILAIVTILFAGIKTFLKGIARYNMESQTLFDDENAVLDDTTEAGGQVKEQCIDFTVPLLVESDCRPVRGASSRSVPDEYDVLASQSYDDSVTSSIRLTSPRYPWALIRILVMLWITNASILVSMTEFGDCSWQYYVLLISTFPLLLSVCIVGFFYVIREQKINPFGVLDANIDWSNVNQYYMSSSFLLMLIFNITLQSSWSGPCAAFCVGCLCSLLGIGGGELMGPLLLSLGITPQVCSATTSVLSMFVSASSLLLYTIRGQMHWQYALWIGSLGMTGGFSGRRIAVFVTWYYNRPSVTIFALVAVLAVAFCLLLYEVLSEQPELEFHMICD